MADESHASISRRDAIRTAVGATAAIGVAAAGVASLAPRRRRSGRKTVRFWHLLSGVWLEPMNRVVSRFNESQSRYELEALLLTTGESDSKLLLSTAGGDPPDMMLVWSQITSAWAASNIIQPLDPFMTPEEMTRYRTNAFPVVARSGWHNGRLYGITMGFDLFVVYYRPDIFRKAGLDPDRFPTSLEEMDRLGDRLNAFSDSGELTRAGFLPQTFQYFIPLFGGNLYHSSTGRLTLNTPENVRALTFMVESRVRLGAEVLRRQGKPVATNGVEGRRAALESVTKFQAGLPSDDGASWPFISGMYGMTIDGEWRVEQLRRNAPELEYRTIPVPPAAGGKPLASFSMVNYLIVPKGARDPDGAWEFLRFWTGLDQPELGAEMYPWQGWMPTLRASETTPVYQSWLNTVPQYRTFLKVAKSDNIVTTPPVPYQTFLMDRLADIDQLAMRGTLTPEAALRKLEDDVAKELARRLTLGLPV